MGPGLRVGAADVTRLRNLPVLAPLLGDAAQLYRWRGMFAELRRYCRRDAERVRFLCDQRASIDGSTVIVISINDDALIRLQQEAMLATALRLAGFRIAVVLRCRACSLAHRIYRAYGISDFVYLDDFSLSAEEVSENAAALARFRGVGRTLAAVKEWRYRSSWIGPQVLATLSRLRFQAMPDLSDGAVQEDLERILPKILEQVIRSEKLLVAVRPVLALVNEANYGNYGPVVDACIAHGVDVVQFIQPWKDDAMTFKRLTSATRRDHPASVAARTLEHFEAVPWSDAMETELMDIFRARYSGEWTLQARNQVDTKHVTKDELTEHFRLDSTKKTAVVFSHVLWDANLFYGEDLFDDMGEWFVETVRAACRNTHVNWLIKLHPANRWKRALKRGERYSEHDLIDRHVGKLPEHVVLLDPDTPISTWSLFRVVDYGITVRGTAGMELPVFGVPVLTAGTGRYSGLGFTVESTDRAEYLSRLAALHELPPLSPDGILRAKRHAYAGFISRLWPMRSFRTRFRYDLPSHHPLRQTLECDVETLAAMKQNGDLEAFADWAVHRRSEVDYFSLPAPLRRRTHGSIPQADKDWVNFR
jgi:hypothetical protein